MQATINFKFPDDKYDYDLMNLSARMHDSLDDISQLLRRIEKYGEDKHLEGCYHERFFEELKEHIRDSGIFDLE